MLSLQGILGTYISQDTVKGDNFQDFIDTSLLRHVMPFDGFNVHSVIILDNASIHHMHVDHVILTVCTVLVY